MFEMTSRSRSLWKIFRGSLVPWLFSQRAEWWPTCYATQRSCGPVSPSRASPHAPPASASPSTKLSPDGSCNSYKASKATVHQYKWKNWPYNKENKQTNKKQQQQSQPKTGNATFCHISLEQWANFQTDCSLSSWRKVMQWKPSFKTATITVTSQSGLKRRVVPVSIWFTWKHKGWFQEMWFEKRGSLPWAVDLHGNIKGGFRKCGLKRGGLPWAVDLHGNIKGVSENVVWKEGQSLVSSWFIQKHKGRFERKWSEMRWSSTSSWFTW